MIVIGTSAYPGSGQDVLADLIAQKFGFAKYGIGDFIRRFATDIGIVHTRENLQNIRVDFDTKHGREYFPTLISDMVIKDNQNTIITGLRRREEFEIFKNKLNFFLLFVSADDEIRAKRVLKRGEIKDPKTIGEFVEQGKKEQALFDLEFLKNNADYIFDCNREWSYYVENFDDLIKKIPIFNSIK